jgi:hypothetical protein
LRSAASSWIDAVTDHEGVGSEGKTYTKRVAVHLLNEAGICRPM